MPPSPRSPRVLQVFLDANILFSAALGGTPFELLWELAEAGKLRLRTSDYCMLEAETNLERKRPDGLPRYRQLLTKVGRVPEAVADRSWAKELVSDKDVPVLAAAVEARADVLLTGDLRHFGPLLDRDDLPLVVRTVRTILLALRAR